MSMVYHPLSRQIEGRFWPSYIGVCARPIRIIVDDVVAYTLNFEFKLILFLLYSTGSLSPLVDIDKAFDTQT